jgi:hypothetical protein
MGAKAGAAPKRWPLLTLGGVVLVGGAAIVLVLGGPAKPTPAPVPTPAPPPPAAVQPAVAPPVIAPPPAATAVAPPAQRATPGHGKKGRGHNESAVVKVGEPAATPTSKSREPRLPSGSKEAYPEK